MAQARAEKGTYPDNAKKQEVFGLVKACILSANEEITSDSLDRDFCTMVGHRIPYREFGYDSLDAYLESLPEIKVRRGPNGVLLLRAARTESVAHIYDLVARQKKKKAYPRRKAKKHPFSDIDRWLEPSDDDSDGHSPAFNGAYSNAGSRQSEEGASTSTQRPYNASSFDPAPDVKGGYQPRKFHTTYRGKHFDPNFNPRGRRPQADFRFQLQASSSVTPEKTEEDKTPQEPAQERKPLEKVVEKVEEMKITESKQEECAKPDTNNEKEPLGPRVLYTRGGAETQQKYDEECVDFIDTITTMPEYAALKYVGALQEYLRENGLPQATFDVKITPSKYCEIKAHLFTFSGCPSSTQTLRDCLQETAVEALRAFHVMSLVQEENLMQPVHFVNRILALVYAQPTGIWRSFISRAYYMKFEEKLPENWADHFLAKTENIAVHRVSGEPNDASSEIWKPKLVPTVSKQPVVFTVSPTRVNHLPSRPLQRTRSVQPLRELAPMALVRRPASPPHKLAIVQQVHMAPRKKYPVEVTCIMPDASFWVRVVSSALLVKYEKMMEDLSTFDLPMSANDKKQALVPSVGACYVAFVASKWQRVKLTNLLQGGMVIVWLIDVGDEEKLPFRSCYQLPDQYADLPGLAARCILDGFEVLDSRPEYVGFLQEAIKSRRFVADVITSHEDLVSVYLSETGSSCDNVVNYDASRELSQAISECRNLSTNQVYNVRVTQVTEEGTVYIRVKDDAELFQKLMSKQVERKLLDHNPKRAVEILVGREIYFARLLDTQNSIYRIVALKEPESGRVFVRFIDSGETGFVPLSCIYELRGFFDQLYHLGAQAMMVRLANIPVQFITKAMGQRLQKLASPDECVLMRVITVTVVPMVELFKRMMPDNVMVSLNHTLLLDPALHGPPALASQKALSHAATATEQAAALTLAADPYPLVTAFTPVPELITLPPALVPPVGTEFDIHVPMVSNPKNFIIQPWNSFFTLQALMFDLQATLKNSGPEDAPPASEIAPGRAFAALHQDGQWYRVTAFSDVISQDSVLANFVDYGDLQVLQLTSLRRLAPRFFELPCQAIRAHLHGVKPLHQDWSIQDCLAFQALVNEHQFVSIVMSKPSNVDRLQESSVGLKLIDTSGSEDVHIDQLLVSEGRAEFMVNGT